MSELSNISGYFSSSQAARLLGVSNHEMARLVRDGELSALKAVGNALLFNAGEVHLYAAIKRGKGRPLSPLNAWAALWLLSGLEASWLNYPQMRRLRIKLKNITPEELVWQTRRRISTKRYRVSRSFVSKLKNELILTGRSCVSLLEVGLTEQTEMLEGYACSDLVTLEKKYHLVEDVNGNMIIHIVKGNCFTLESIDQMPVAVIAADLAITLDTREHRAGLDTLRRLLDEFSKT
jgi:excisionase family DNA binding protein